MVIFLFRIISREEIVHIGLIVYNTIKKRAKNE